MEELNTLLSYLRWDTSLKQLEEVKIEFKKMNDHDLIHLIQPIDKMHWDNAAELLVEIGYPRIKNIVPELLEWLMDINWPGAQRISELLVSIGEPLIPHIREAFKSGDHIWNYWIIESILNYWPQSLVEQLKEDLVMLASEFDYEEAHYAALEILITKKIFTKDRLLHLIDTKQQDARNNELSDKLDLLRKMIANELE